MGNNNKDLEVKMKRCRKCEEEFPATKEYFHSNKSGKDGLRSYCKDCVKSQKNKYSSNDSKKCVYCKEILPINKFSVSKKSFDGIMNICINCQEENREKKINTDHKICIKCNRNLPLTEEYFQKDKLCTDDFRNVCKECQGKNFGISNIQKWTDKDDKILIENYPYMSNREIVEKFFPTRIKSDVSYRANKILGLYKDKKYRKRIIKCSYCGIDIALTFKHFKNSDARHYCSVECKCKWCSENLSGENSPVYGKKYTITTENRLKIAEKAVSTLKRLNFSRKPTKPQLITNDLLDGMGIKFENEYDCKYYLVDNYLTDYNLMIEVMGNFFHCSPVTNLENSRKVKIIGKDKAKHTYIKKYKSIEVLYLWEKDLYKNIEMCKALVLKYINNNGILDNYHSFNYHFDEYKELKLIDNLYVIGY